MMATFKYGANFRVTGKADPQSLSYPQAWQATQGSFADLAGHIGQGHPWMPALLDRGQRREQPHSNHAEVLGLDIDSGLAIDQALNHPFISAHCGLGIESASSSPEHEKFRLIFKTVAPIGGWATIRICNRYLAHLVGSADPACKDASRYFFGAPGRTPFLLNEAATLPASFIEDALAWDAAEVARATAEAEEKRRRWAEYKAQNPSDSGDIVKDALSYIAPYNAMCN